MPAELPIAELRVTWLKVAVDFGTVKQQVAAPVNFAASCTEVAARVVAPGPSLDNGFLWGQFPEGLHGLFSTKLLNKAQ